MTSAAQCVIRSLEGARLRPHDLLRLNQSGLTVLEDSAPAWVKSALSGAPYVVVRRGAAPAGMISVGVRGVARGERFGGLISERDIAGTVTPEFLAQTETWPTQPRRAAVPALLALEGVAAVLNRAGLAWGPVGSVGFELATGRETATATSDLDIVIDCPERLRKTAARALAESLMGANCRIDAILETPSGGVALLDWIHARSEVLLRTGQGSILVADPWVVRADATTLS
jgi:phosphoribosyl-dephospho-CoA transferase